MKYIPVLRDLSIIVSIVFSIIVLANAKNRQEQALLEVKQNTERELALLETKKKPSDIGYYINEICVKYDRLKAHGSDMADLTLTNFYNENCNKS